MVWCDETCVFKIKDDNRLYAIKKGSIFDYPDMKSHTLQHFSVQHLSMEKLTSTIISHCLVDETYVHKIKDEIICMLLTLFPMGYFPTDFPWEVVVASPAHANGFLNF